jgi:hypothetical protein
MNIVVAKASARDMNVGTSSLKTSTDDEMGISKFAPRRKSHWPCKNLTFEAAAASNSCRPTHFVGAGRHFAFLAQLRSAGSMLAPSIPLTYWSQPTRKAFGDFQPRQQSAPILGGLHHQYVRI